MDTDGCPNGGAAVTFSQKVGRLSDDFVRLVKSLGGFPSVYKITTDGYALSEMEMITFNLLDNPFNLPRKAAKVTERKKLIEHQAIVSIKPCVSLPMRCLTVDSED
jgi:hypothetical protein